VKVTSACICGSDLHLYEGYMPGMKKGVRTCLTKHLRAPGPSKTTHTGL